MLVFMAERNDKRILGKAKNESEIKYDKYSIVAFCKTEIEMNEIYNLYYKDLDVENNDNFEKVVIKNEVIKK